MLKAQTHQLWLDYLAAEKDRIRSLTMPALDHFIESLLQHEAEVWHAWALDLARQVSDERAEIPVRFPLFRQVLLPTLADGVRRELPGCARWLAEFESLLVNSDAGVLPDHLQSSVGLLREAIRVDAADSLARRRLVSRWSSYLDYTLHELPDGVLYGQNGATAEQCGELLELLDEFRGHVRSIGETEKFAELISECDFHFRSYREYLLQERPGGSYEEFLASLDSEG
ncbi:MAG TPA: hypothetical protein VF789_08360 [Thermoanaerobaculia bacterium]